MSFAFVTGASGFVGSHLVEALRRNGTPVLFPFPNRIRDGKYSFGGKSYSIPVGTKGHAIHGFAIAANWASISGLNCPSRWASSTIPASSS